MKPPFSFESKVSYQYFTMNEAKALNFSRHQVGSEEGTVAIRWRVR